MSDTLDLSSNLYGIGVTQLLSSSTLTEGPREFMVNMGLTLRPGNNQRQELYTIVVQNHNPDSNKSIPRNCLSNITISEDSKACDETLSGKHSYERRVDDACIDVESIETHIEIIKPKVSVSRRVTGANRVVPFITSVWQSSGLHSKQLTLERLYSSILKDPSSRDDRYCNKCCLELLSVTHLEHHSRAVHFLEEVRTEQCFVCRKKYIFELQLKHHLSEVHGIQYPETICKICFMEFNTVMEEKAHERKHEKIYSCQFCSSKFASEYFYQKHYNQHLVYLQPHECIKCGKRFLNALSLKMHEWRHNYAKCVVCEAVFVDDLELLKHVKEHGVGGVREFLSAARVADEEEDHAEKLVELYLKHSGSLEGVQGCLEGLLSAVCTDSDGVVTSTESGGFECKLCGMELSSAEDLVSHRQNSHLRSRTCPFCGRRSRSVSQTWRHIATHLRNAAACQQASSEQDMACRVCHKLFSSKGKLNSHLEAVHKIEAVARPFSCEICCRKFQHSTSRDRHKVLHEDAGGSWKCTKCPKVFLRPKFLLKHSREHDTTHSCSTCNKIFGSSGKLQAHQRQHDSHRKFRCSCCPVSCPTLSGLRVHMRTHTDERPYRCEQCNKSFRRMHALRSHSVLLHAASPVQTLGCPHCPVRFACRGNLLRHVLVTHLGQRRFVCGVCGARCSQNQDLRRHLTSRHAVTPPDNPFTTKRPLSEVYVIPSIDNLEESDPHATRIRGIVEEERQKYTGIEDLLGQPTTAQEVLLPILVPCELCGNSHEAEKYSCKHCKAQFCSKTAFLDHNASEHIITVFRCGACLTDFVGQAELQEHVANNHQRLSKPDSAPTICEPPVNRPRSPPPVVKDSDQQLPQQQPEENVVVANEKNLSHLSPDPAPAGVGGQQLDCPYCDKHFSESAKLTRHLKLHQGLKPHCCGICGRAFAESCNLKVHMRIHTGERPYECARCGKRMRYQKEAAEHERAHAGLRPHACETCGRAFLRRRELDRHRTTHSAKCHMCPVCGKTFARLDQLRGVHLPRHQPGAPRHICHTCGKGFHLRSKYNKHLKTHSGEKTFKCELCPKSFARVGHLRRHQRTHSKETPGCSQEVESLPTSELQDMGINLLDPESLLGTDKCNTIIYLEMAPEDLDVTLESSLSK